METPASFATAESNERLVSEAKDVARAEPNERLVIEAKDVTASASNERLLIERRDTELAVQSRPAAPLAGGPIARVDSAPPASQPLARGERVERIERESSPPTEHRTERIDLFLDHGSPSRSAPARSRAVTFRSDSREDGASPSSPATPVKGREAGTGSRPDLSGRIGSRTVDGKPIGGARVEVARSEAPAGRTPTDRAASGRPSSRPPVGNRGTASTPAPTSGRPAPMSGRPAPAPTSGRPAPMSARPAPTSGRPAAAPMSSRGAPAPMSGRPAPLSGRPAAAPTSARPTLREDSPAAPTDSAAPRRGGIARSARPSIREDNVGAAANRAPDAVGLAGRAIPRLLKTKAEIAAAPIDHRAGFLLSYIDGATSVQGLVDIAAMPEEDVHEILERLRRLGIVSIR